MVEADTKLITPAEGGDGSRSERGRTAAPWWFRGKLVLAGLIFFTAFGLFLWPAYRAFLNIEIEENEGWNAYYADAALGRTPLYPSADKLITNNYTPLSFYIVGGAGRLLGDPVLAGRLISLCAVLAIGFAIALMVQELGGSRLAAAIGGAFFIATITRFCGGYVGMNDPQLLAQAVMAFGFAWFLKAVNADRGFYGPILLMLLAGFIKHNIIAMPLTAFVWLAVHRPRTALKCAGVALAGAVLGFALCYAAYGSDFFANLRSAREYSWRVSIQSIPRLRCVDVAVGASLIFAWVQRRKPQGQIVGLLVVIGFLAYVLQKTGAGVDDNAMFDLLIGAAMGVGLAISYMSLVPRGRFFSPEVVQCLLLLAICYRLVPSRRLASLPSVRLFFDRSMKTEIAIREKAMADSVARVRATPGDVMSSMLVCYRAGKPFVVDNFNLHQRIATGAVPPDVLSRRRNDGTLTKVDPDPRSEWLNPLVSGRGGDAEGIDKK